MDKYLITGGSGFIGSQILNKVSGINFDIKHVQDILNPQDLSHALKDTKGVFHCAAKISVPESFVKKDEYEKINVDGTKNVISAAEHFDQKIVFSSSAAVYGENNFSVSEDDPLMPRSPYAENKRDAEELLSKSKIPHVALRYFNVYGPGQSPAYAGVITSFILNALQNKDIEIFGDGNQIRDFIFIDDVVEANLAAMNLGNNSFEVFNIASGNKTSISDLAKIIIHLTKSSSNIIYKQERQGDIIYSSANVDKAKAILNWKSKTNLEQGLEKTIAFYSARKGASYNREYYHS
jgi:UDP-glucose 4-epimerase